MSWVVVVVVAGDDEVEDVKVYATKIDVRQMTEWIVYCMVARGAAIAA